MRSSTIVHEVAEYKKRRDELITQDRALRADHSREPLSPAEALAEEVIRKLKTTEAATLWSADYPSIPHPFPGMEFLTGRSIIMQSKLFEILSKMPKGSLLHGHFDAMGQAPALLDLALKQPAVHVRCAERLTASNIQTVPPEFLCLPEDMYPDLAGSVSLTDANYQHTWISAQLARELFDPQLGGPGGFDRWVLAAMTINPSEAYGTHNTVKKVMLHISVQRFRSLIATVGFQIWEKFASTFGVYERIVHYVPIFREYFRQFLLSAIEDGVSYIEIRMNLTYKVVAADAKTELSTREIFLILDNVLKELTAEFKQQGREDEFIGAKIIITAFRLFSVEIIETLLHGCIALKKEFPHLIAGFDLVGQEDVLQPLIYYAEPLLKFRQMQQDAGVDEIPFLFHAGETFTDGTEADMNLYDAILLGTKRIGHAFSLLKHPKLIEMCKEREIAIEVCPISNEVLRLTSSMHMHPVSAFFNHGLRVVLSSDDPCIWQCVGLTFDFYQVLVSSELTGIIQLGEVAKDSIKYSMLSPDEKQRALVAWQKRWDKFLEYVAGFGREVLSAHDTTSFT
ncbi:hypothetical protein D9758_000760 [Tetrapyrgos nigripes]|uniref:adenosine deaminase n=1 Tax=Tetrapyrgos nigripes TaxID=182062 RepID=A0A8H5GZ70_9AGAR|nr:hypothetical protein D9758_000760 [Tetrapyrgos nigripes]